MGLNVSETPSGTLQSADIEYGRGEIDPAISIFNDALYIFNSRKGNPNIDDYYARLRITYLASLPIISYDPRTDTIRIDFISGGSYIIRRYLPEDTNPSQENQETKQLKATILSENMWDIPHPFTQAIIQHNLEKFADSLREQTYPAIKFRTTTLVYAFTPQDPLYPLIRRLCNHRDEFINQNFNRPIDVEQIGILISIPERHTLLFLYLSKPDDKGNIKIEITGDFFIPVNIISYLQQENFTFGTF